MSVHLGPFWHMQVNQLVPHRFELHYKETQFHQAAAQHHPSAAQQLAQPKRPLACMELVLAFDAGWMLTAIRQLRCVIKRCRDLRRRHVQHKYMAVVQLNRQVVSNSDENSNTLAVGQRRDTPSRLPKLIMCE